MPKKRREERGAAAAKPGAPVTARPPGGAAKRTPERAASSASQRGAEHAPALDASAAAHTAQILWLAMAILVAARAVLAFVPSMAGWGLNLQRFLPPGGWLLWALAALPLLPAIGRRLEPGIAGLGRAIARRPMLATLGAICFGVGLVLLLPDQVRFVGDFLIRQGTVREAVLPNKIYPQALPLDVLLHYTIPRAINDLGLGDANTAARVIGALDAAALAWLAVRFARALELSGVAAAACAAVVWFGGYVGLFTGFGKAFAEECVLVACLGTFGVQAVRTGRGLWPLGVALALGVTLHRSALAFVPGVVLVWVLWWLAYRGEPGAWRRGLLPALVPLATLAIMLPRIAAIVRRFDSVHFTPYEVTHQGPLAAAFAGGRPWDMLGLVTMLSPLAIALPLLLVAAGRSALRRRELWVLVLLALPMLVTMPFIHPAQGMFRDWDDFAALGAALSLVTAWLVAETLRSAREWTWLAPAVLLGTAAPTVGWLLHHTDIERGLVRVEAFMNEPPARTGAERATTFDFIGSRNENLGRYGPAADAFARAVETAPSPRMLLLWAVLANRAGRIDEAQTAYRRLVATDSTSLPGWIGLAGASYRLHQYDEAKRAAERARVVDPNAPEPHDALMLIERAMAQERGTPNAPAPNTPGPSPRGATTPPGATPPRTPAPRGPTR